MTISSPGLRSSDWATMLSPSVALTRPTILSASVPSSAASATRGTRMRSVRSRAEERDRLALELELPVLVGLEHRARAGAERAVIEEDDVLPKEEVPREIVGHVSALSGWDRVHRAGRRRTASSRAR